LGKEGPASVEVKRGEFLIRSNRDKCRILTLMPTRALRKSTKWRARPIRPKASRGALLDAAISARSLWTAFGSTLC